MDADLYRAVTTGDIDGIIEIKEKVKNKLPDEDYTILHIAAQSNKPITVEAIMMEFPELLQKLNSRKETALHLAAVRGYSSVVKVLVNKSRHLGPETDSALGSWKGFIRRANVEMDTALHLAVRNNHLEVVKLLVEADPGDRHSQNSNSETPLYLAATLGYEDIIKEILKNCKDPNFDGPQGRTALHAAVISHNRDCVEVVSRGDLVQRADNRGWTAMHHAAFHNYVSLLKMLALTKDQYNDSTFKKNFKKNPMKSTPLHIAAQEGHSSTVLELFNLYPEYIIAAVDDEGRNVLHIAADCNQKTVVQCILQECPNLEELLNKKDENGNTPLHLLVMRGSFVPELIEHARVKRNAKNHDNLTPLDLLYFDEDIVGEQLKIKEALEDALHNDRRRGYRGKSENSEPKDKRSRKEAKFKRAKARTMKDEVQLYRERTNTQIIVTALITTVTFTVGFTLPGGYHQEEGKSNQGMAVLSGKKAFKVFMISDAVALLLSISSLFLYFMSSIYNDVRQVSTLIAASTALNIVSVVAMMLTFSAGTYAVLPHSTSLALIVSVISFLFFPCVIILLVKWIYDRHKMNKLKV